MDPGIRARESPAYGALRGTARNRDDCGIILPILRILSQSRSHPGSGETANAKWGQAVPAPLRRDMSRRSKAATCRRTPRAKCLFLYS